MRLSVPPVLLVVAALIALTTQGAGAYLLWTPLGHF
jgi:hypothetical protein